MAPPEIGSDEATPVAEALDEALQALDHLGEGEPDGLGIEHLEVAAFDADTPIEERIDRMTSGEEWERLDRPDYEDREVASRALTVKIAAAKALDASLPGELDWTDLVVPRLAERPFRIQCDRRDDLRVYAASMLVEGVATAAAATFPRD